MRKRAIILNTAIIFGFIAVFLRLVDLMVLNHGRFSERARIQQLKQEDIQVRRGFIFDRRGRELGVNLEVESLFCDPSAMVSPQTAASSMSGVLGEKPEAMLAKFSSKGRFVWVERKINAETAEKIKKMDIKGVGFVQDTNEFWTT